MLVLFSSRGRQNFEFVKTFARTKVNKLYLVDRTGESWYQEGVPGFGDDVQGIASELRRVMHQGRFKSVTCFGASMGAYAAIVVGALAQVERVVAFSPQVEFNEGWPLTPPKGVPLSHTDARGAVKRAKRTHVRIVTSGEPLDVYHASILSGLRNVVTEVRHGSHNVLLRLRNHDALLPTVGAFIKGKDYPAECLSIEVASMGGKLKPFLELFHAGQFKKALPLAKRLAAMHHDWPHASFVAGTCYAEMKRYSEAIPYLSRAHAMDNLNNFFYPPLICAYASQGVTTKAEELTAEYVGLTRANGEDVPAALDKLALSAFSAKAYSLAESIRRDLTVLHGVDTVPNLYQMARSMAATGKRAKATEVFQSVIDRAEELPRTLAWMKERAHAHIADLQPRH
ncbi:tetratricopeptide repeat protein [Sinorhizobium meliloti]|uniref:tetratricopeptide repeat protein n=1 Tax=Rhizobium meliloti TaxID=382 RepID=UPI000FDA5691|nr:tetratricopeptide repeat protein [Sinorhizobium meliloti]RVF00054.1 tetratricopeptide repeat protein [Sinorhizobium meliloti]RVH38974.1 tetratricopeptide repeat protein [Sinorhizobium meliloti]RVK08531.1 tetratricopeptide repeat protein [Sinorhizobium meliloti]